MNNLYVKKPIPVEAFCFNEDPMPEWFIKHPFKMVHKENGNVQITISTLEGDMTCRGEDYIIRGTHGELYPCRRDVFLETYERYIPTFTITLNAINEEGN